MQQTSATACADQGKGTWHELTPEVTELQRMSMGQG